jgi:hypothetical protein
MIPFNLERAKKGIPMKTRGSQKAKFIAVLNGGQPAPLVIEVIRRNADTSLKIPEEGRVENYYINGRHGTVHDSELDLFMEY